jgi:hypothetical protein
VILEQHGITDIAAQRIDADASVEAARYIPLLGLNP